MNPDQTINLNQNAAQCIHEASHFGKTVYYNICTQTQVDVLWGGVDWTLAILGISFAACVCLVVIGLIAGFIITILD